ncbi:MAG: sulfatase-like hydrolase/transferase [Chthoniobacteraceae bacterium]
MRFLALLLALAVTASARQPNLIMIMADDLGYECIGANGSTSYKTPVLDKLAATGMRFEHCNVQPLCTPTRVQLMTGIYNVRNYINFGNMDPACVTFGNVLKQGGYATCIVGKWQLGQDRELPKKFGFDEHCLWQHTRRPPRFANPGLEINGVAKDYSNGEYGPTLVNDYALDFITRKKDAPFFLYYPMILTHSPYQATPDSPTWDPKLTGENKGKRPEHFADMVAYMDKMIGRLVAKLDELGIRDDTVIVFIGDNGTGGGTRSMLGERVVMGGKGTLKHTGTHVPLIVNGPGRVAAGKVSTDLVDSTDFLPTLCEAAGVAAPAKIDGRSFWPQLRGERGTPREWWYCWYGPREEFVGEFAANQHYELHRDGKFFDLRKDTEEQQPLAIASLDGEAAAAAKTLQGALDQFKDARPANLAKPAAGKGGRKKKKTGE